MKHEFKPNDLALVIGVGSANNFKTVELIEHLGAPQWVKVGSEQFHNTHGEDMWLVRSMGEPIIPSKQVTELFGITSLTEAPIATRKLIPLRGDENPDAQLATSAPRQAVTA